MDPSQTDLDEIKALRKKGLYLEAQRRLQGRTAPEEWEDGERQTAAALVLERVGEPRRARRLVRRVWRRDPTSRSPAREEMIWLVFSFRGALTAWEWWQRCPIPAGMPLEETTDHLGLGAYLLGTLRDYVRAQELLTEGLRQHPDNTWLFVVGGLLESMQDRPEPAVELLRRALELNPAAVGGIHGLADALVASGREGEAVEALEDAVNRIEAASLAVSLATLQFELGDFAGAERSLDRYAELTPNAEEESRNWLAARRCDLACHLGQPAAAAAHAGRVKGSVFYERLCTRLSGSHEGLQRRELGVGFVRQHQLTCAPATFTTLARYWHHDVDHLELAEAICYDGTPYHSERRWAEENGWATREFTITPETTKMLIDRGLPFALSTVHPGRAHCQAVIGYDEFRGVFLIRDPYHRSKGEFLIEEALEEQAPSGPRGLVMTPRSEAARLEGLALPEAELYDAYHDLQLALERHDRPDAEQAFGRLQALAPEHRLTWQGAHALACYDGQPAAALAALDALHALHPAEVNIQLRRLNRLADLEKSDERLRQLRAASERVDSHPLLWIELARSLSTDARRHPEARRWLHRIRRHRLDAEAVHTEAVLLWDEQAFEEGVEYFRLAACLDDKNEYLALAYFRAARWVRRTEEALAVLRRRFDREGTRSSLPARSLFQAYEILDRMDEGFAVLEDAQHRRPDDADLRLFHAQQLAAYGRNARARELVDSTEGLRWRSSARSRVLATLAGRQREGAEALDLWRGVLAGEPLAMDAHRAVATLLAERGGPTAALEHLRTAAAHFPHHLPLHVLVVEWARGDQPESWEAAARHLLSIDPTNAWGRRELALALKAQRRLTEALEAVDEAIVLEPSEAAGQNIRGGILLEADRRDEGRASLHEALRLSIDADSAMAPLLASCHSSEERLADLRFLQAELTRQATSGNAVLAFSDLAAPYLNADEFLSFLHQGHAERADLWQTGVVLARQMARMKRWDEAVAVATRVSERFPLVPRVWEELGLIHGARPDHAAAIAALDQARQLNPAWPLAMRELAAAYRAASRFDEARAVMDQAVRHAPSDGLNHGWLAEFLYHDGEKEAAVDEIREALRLFPDYDWAWGALQRWGGEIGQPGAARLEARELVARRPGEARSWLILARMLDENHEFDERMAALERALEISPRATAARDEKARQLALAGRFDQALALCQAGAEAKASSGGLQVRAAWVFALKGDLPAAIATMREALELDSANTWGWQLLAEWHQERKEWAEAEKAVSHLVRLNPNDAFPHGFLGDLKLLRDNRAEAKGHFRRAVDIDAGYTYGGLRLFDLQLEDREFDGARDTLEQIRPHLTLQVANAREVIFYISKHDLKAALDALRILLRCPEDAPVQIACVLKILRDRAPDWASAFGREAFAAVGQPSSTLQAGAFYVETRLMQGRLVPGKALALLTPGLESTERALVPLLNDIGRRAQLAVSTRQLFGLGMPRFYLGRLRRRYGAWLHQRDQLWGLVGFVFSSMGRPRAVCRWMADWKTRSEAEPWMLNNLVVALQKCGRHAEATELRHHVLSLPQHDDTMQRFQLWTALDEALDGQANAAAARAANTDPARYDAYDKSLKSLLDIILSFSKPTEPPPSFGVGTRATLASFIETHRSDRTMCRVFTRACQLIAKRRGSCWPRVWGYAKSHPSQTAVAWVVAALFVLFCLTRLAAHP